MSSSKKLSALKRKLRTLQTRLENCEEQREEILEKCHKAETKIEGVLKMAEKATSAKEARVMKLETEIADARETLVAVKNSHDVKVGDARARLQKCNQRWETADHKCSDVQSDINAVESEIDILETAE